jgi:hypothetical protein
MSAEVLDKVRDAVVYVDVVLTMPDGAEARISGSGFCINDSGRLITNAHVVSPVLQLEGGQSELAQSRSVHVIFHAGTDEEERVPAVVVRENRDKDLALLKIERETPQYLELADSEATEQMTKLVVCGYPLGMREISLRPGVLTARRTLDDQRYIEHDAEADDGNSGGPVVTLQGGVVGVHTWTPYSTSMSTRFAVPSNTVRDWLASDPAADPPVYFASGSSTGGQEPARVTAGGEQAPEESKTTVEELLAGTDLEYEWEEGNIYKVSFPRITTVRIHEYDNMLRLFTKAGELDETEALDALTFTYYDPIGRFSLGPVDDDDEEKLFWEVQIPLRVMTSDYLERLCEIAAEQTYDYFSYRSDSLELQIRTDLYPGGDDAALTEELGKLLWRTGISMETHDDQTFKLSFDSGVEIYAQVFNGMAYMYCYVGGMPGEDPPVINENLSEILRLNWEDPIGRLAVDDEFDVVWECLIPMEHATPDHLYVMATVGNDRVEQYWDRFGHVPFTAERTGGAVGGGD